jgi:hypothetical protein
MIMPQMNFPYTYYSNPRNPRYLPQAAPAFPPVPPDDPPDDPPLGGLGGLFNRLRGRFGPGRSLFKDRLNLGSLKNLGRDIRGTRLWEGGPSIGGAATAGMGLYQGVNAAKNLYDLANTSSDINKSISDVRASALANPLVYSYLDSGSARTLRQVQNGTFSEGSGLKNGLAGAAKGIPSALLATLIGGVAGGVPGAVVNGLGSLANSGIKGASEGKAEANERLQSLYQQLLDAENRYRSESSGRMRERYFGNYY